MWKAYTVRQGDMLSNLGFGLHKMEKDYPQLEGTGRGREERGGEKGDGREEERRGKKKEGIVPSVLCFFSPLNSPTGRFAFRTGSP